MRPLLKKCSDVKARLQKDKVTALHQVVRNGNKEAEVRQRLEHKADIDVKENKVQQCLAAIAEVGLVPTTRD